MATKKVISKNAVTRRAGYLYYIDGNGSVVETKMNRKGGKKGRSVCSPKPAAKKAAPKKKAAKKKPAKKAAPRKAATRKAAPRKTARKAPTKRRTAKRK